MRRRYFTAILWLSGASTSLLAGTIYIQPATTTVTVGQIFTLSVEISGAADLYGYQFDLGFNPTELKALSVTEGAFLPTGGPTIFLPGTIDNVGGSIASNADILNGAVSGVNGSGDLLDVSFQALATGSSGVQIFNLIALDSYGLGLTETTAGATVNVSTPEPATSLLLAAGVLGLFAFRKLKPSA